jgi:hypothetical protein
VRGKKNRRGQLEGRDQNSKEQIMTTRIGTLLGSILLLMAAMASAQTVQRVTVTIPFSFVAGSHSLPAGDYTIELNHEKDTMILRSEDRSGNHAVMLANNSQRATNSNQSYAIFQRYGSHYFLAEVWKQGAGQTLTPGNLERELASKRPTVEVARVEARLSPR